MNQKTAILIFANSAQKEAFAKPFKSSKILFDELNNHTLKTAKASGFPFFHISEKEQTGNSFGERFTNAIQSIYDKGFDSVISIGNDTPHLNTNQILQAAKQLETNDIVLGPSLDGGFYLMGLKKSMFNAEVFIKLPWQTSRLAQDIYRLIVANDTALVTLEALSDIDTLSDIEFILQSKRVISSKLKRILSDIISEDKISVFTHHISFQDSFLHNFFNKGSPYLIHI